MTDWELSKYQHLKKEIAELAEELSRMPEPEKDEARRRILVRRTKESEKALLRLEHYISGIEDPLIRRIIWLKKVKGKSWGEVARAIGGGNTSDGVRKTYFRFLNKRE